jgi:hypothetical protein
MSIPRIVEYLWLRLFAVLLLALTTLACGAQAPLPTPTPTGTPRFSPAATEPATSALALLPTPVPTGTPTSSPASAALATSAPAPLPTLLPTPGSTPEPTASLSPRPTPMPTPQRPAAEAGSIELSGRLLIDSPAGRLYASGRVGDKPQTFVLATMDGRLLATYDIASQLGLHTVHGWLYVDRDDQGLAVLDAQTGTLHATIPLPDRGAVPEAYPRPGPAPQADPATG